MIWVYYCIIFALTRLSSRAKATHGSNAKNIPIKMSPNFSLYDAWLMRESSLNHRISATPSLLMHREDQREDDSHPTDANDSIGSWFPQQPLFSDYVCVRIRYESHLQTHQHADGQRFYCHRPYFPLLLFSFCTHRGRRPDTDLTPVTASGCPRRGRPGPCGPLIRGQTRP